MQVSLRRTVETNGVILHIIVNGHARVEAAKLCNLTHVPVEWIDLEPNQELQLATALDAPYGHWDDNKLRVRLRRLEVQNLDMDAVCRSTIRRV